MQIEIEQAQLGNVAGFAGSGKRTHISHESNGLQIFVCDADQLPGVAPVQRSQNVPSVKTFYCVGNKPIHSQWLDQKHQYDGEHTHGADLAAELVLSNESRQEAAATLGENGVRLSLYQEKGAGGCGWKAQAKK